MATDRHEPPGARELRACPHCGARLNVSPVPSGKRLRCPKCKKALRLAPNRNHLKETFWGSSIRQDVVEEEEPPRADLPEPAGPAAPTAPPAATDDVRTSVFLRKDFLETTQLNEFLDALRGPEANDLDRQIASMFGKKMALESADIEEMKVSSTGSGVRPSLAEDAGGPESLLSDSPDGPALTAPARDEIEDRLLEILVQAGRLSSEQVERCREAQEKARAGKRVGLPLSHYAVKLGLVSGQELVELLRRMAPVPGTGDVVTGPELRRALSPAGRMASGIQIGNYRVLGEIGRGGAGSVFRVEDVRDGRVRALKLLLSARDSDERARHRFRREIEATRMLQHPNIIRIYDVDEHQGLPYFTMDHVEGETLQAILDKRKGRAGEDPGLRTLVKFLAEILDALAYAHSQGIVHRDVKPSNILVDREGRARLTDFGLAKRTLSGSLLTRTGDIIGTPFYMAPEQVKGEQGSIGPASDTYAVGVILYQCLAGRLPFEARSSEDLFRQICASEPIPPAKLAGWAAPELEAICLKALAKDSARRYARASEFAEELRRAQAGVPEEPAPPRGLSEFWRKARVRLLAAVAAFLLVAGGFAAAVYHEGPREVRPPRPALDIDKVLAEARAEAAAGWRDRAVALCDRAILADADNGPAYFLKVEILLAGGTQERERAGTALEALLARSTSRAEAYHPRAYRLLGTVHLTEERWSAAVASFSATIALAPEDREAHAGRAEAYARLGQTSRASEDRRRARELGRRAVEEIVREARALSSAGGGREAAIAKLREALAIDPADEAAVSIAGSLLVAEGRLVEALEAYSAAVEFARGPGQGGASLAPFLSARSETLLLLGDLALAREDAEQAVEASPADPAALLALGLVRSAEGRSGLALASIEKAAAVRRDDPALLRSRAQVLFAAGRFDEAQADLDRAIALDPSDARALALRGRILLEYRSDARAAESDLAAALAAGCPDEARVRLDLARVRAASGHAVGALRDVEELLRATPDSPEIRLERAALLRTLGRPAEALEEVEGALLLAPYLARAYAERGYARLALGTPLPAAADFGRALAAQPGDTGALEGRILAELASEGDIPALAMDAQAWTEYLGMGPAGPRPELFGPTREEIFFEAFGAGRPVPDPRRLEELARGALSEIEFVREASIQALAVAEEEATRALERLCEGLAADSSPSVRAREALAALAAQSAAAERRALVRSLAIVYHGGDLETLARWRARPDDVFGALAGIVQDGSEPVWARRLAARALVGLRHPEVFEHLVSWLSSGSVTDDRVAIVAGELLRCGWMLTSEFAASLLDSGEPWVQAEVLFWVPAAPPVVRFLSERLGRRDPRVELAIAWYLAKNGEERGFPILVRAARDPDEHVRRFAVWALGQVPGGAAPELLARALADPDAAVRRQAAAWLAVRADAFPAERLRLAFANDMDRAARTLAGVALGTLKDADSITPMGEVLSDPRRTLLLRTVAGSFYHRLDRSILWQGGDDPRVSGEGSDGMAFTTLAHALLAGRDAGESVARLLGDAEGTVRAAAAVAARSVPGPEVARKLLSLLSDPDERVATAAGAALVYQVHLHGEAMPDVDARLASGSQAARRGAARAYRVLATDQWPDVASRGGPAASLENRLELLARAIRLAPGTALPHRDLGRVLAGTGRLEEAVRAYEEGARLGDADAAFHREMGDVLARLSRSEDAIARWGLAVRLDPFDLAANLSLARLLLDAGRSEEALVQIRRARAIDPRCLESYLLEARYAYAVQGAVATAKFVHVLLELGWFDASGELHFLAARADAAQSPADATHFIEHLRKAKAAGFDIRQGAGMKEFEPYLGREEVSALLRGE
ncbi:MAG: protein kinase [Planctomycetes bacterium]|nr:protein kinase [Planctomycetota bacterium]